MLLIHIFLVCVTGLVVIFSDEQAFMWILGKKKVLDAKLVEILHVLVSIGLLCIILTGGLMFIDRASYLLSTPAFLMKMCFVAALVINAFFIGTLSKIATTRAFAELSLNERIPLFVSGGVSIVGWAGALICAFFL